MIRAFLVFCLLISVSAQAENWQLITDSQVGTRLIVDVDSAKLDYYTKNESTKEKSIRVHAVMKMLTPDSQELTFISAIDGNDCVYRQAGVLVNILSKDKTQTYFWSLQGDKLYDTQGMWLCNFLVTAVEQYEKTKPATPKSKQKIKV